MRTVSELQCLFVKKKKRNQVDFQSAAGALNYFTICQWKASHPRWWSLCVLAIFFFCHVCVLLQSKRKVWGHLLKDLMVKCHFFDNSSLVLYLINMSFCHFWYQMTMSHTVGFTPFSHNVYMASEQLNLLSYSLFKMEFLNKCKQIIRTKLTWTQSCERLT